MSISPRCSSSSKAVHIPSPQHREFRSLVKYRKTLDGRINNTKNAFRAWFVNHGISIDHGDKAWHTGRQLIKSYRKPLSECGDEELWRGQLDIELTIRDSLTAQLGTVVKRLEEIGKQKTRKKKASIASLIPGHRRNESALIRLNTQIKSLGQTERAA